LILTHPLTHEELLNDTRNGAENFRFAPFVGSDSDFIYLQGEYRRTPRCLVKSRAPPTADARVFHNSYCPPD